MSIRLTVLGGGPGGYTAAFAAARAGMTVTLVEQEHLGGTCLNYGCIPTKTLKASADALDLALRLSEFGIVSQGAHVDMGAVNARKSKVRDVLRGGLEKSCAKLKIQWLRGRGRLHSARQVDVHMADGTVQRVENDALILATGSRVLELPGLPFDGQHILSSDHALDLTHVPQRLIIVGGGVVGCEMAFIYRSFGAEVTVVEGQDRLLPLPSVDGEVSKLLQREMKKRGIVCETGRTLGQIALPNQQEQESQRIRAVLGPSPFLNTHTAAQSKEVSVEADAILVTVGRAPNTTDLGLKDAGISLDARGWVTADHYMCTSAPQVYAVGDVLGPQRVMLAHVAATEGLCAVRHCLAQAGGTEKAVPMDYDAVPSAIFTSPEVGCVGLSEEQAKAQGRNVHCPAVPFRELGKAQAMGELPGFFKLVLDAQSGKVLGAHIAGAHASDLVAELTLALRLGATAKDIADTIHAHPTLAEGVYEAALLGLEA